MINTNLLNLLKKHDWSYEMSDDHTAWQYGQAQRDAIYDNIESVTDLAMALTYAVKVPEPTRARYIAKCEEALNG